MNWGQIPDQLKFWKRMLKEAVIAQDVNAASQVEEHLRWVWGMTYPDILQLLHELCPEIDPDVLDATWEDLMQEAERIPHHKFSASELNG